VALTPRRSTPGTPGGRTGDWLPDGAWLFGLLALLVVLPTACILWLLTQTVAREGESARQQILEAYRGQLRLGRSRVDAHWAEFAERLEGPSSPARQFARLVAEHQADGAVILDADGQVAFPDVAATDPATSALARRFDDAERDGTVTPGEVADLAAALNDYDLAIAASGRLALMERLRARAPNVRLPTEGALRLSMALVAAERPMPEPHAFRTTALPGIWALTAPDLRVMALYRTGRLEAMMHDLLHEEHPAGIRFLAFPPGEPGGAEAVAAGPWLPGWQLTFQPLDMTLFAAASRRQVTAYVAAGLVGIGLTAVVGVLAGRTMGRRLRLARLKTDLVATVSHELRTPVASMRVLVDGLLADDEVDPAKVRDYLRMLSAENERLGRLIENFLTYARLDRGRQTFVVSPTDPAALVASAVAAVRDHLPAGSDLRVEVAPGLPSIEADTGALGTALVNVIDNAVKYTPADKRIVVRAYRDGETHVCLEVEDNGIGIPAGERRRIFRRFYQVEQRLSRETGGVGLGLSIVDLIVRAHGGTVRVQDAPTSGSVFTLRLPCASGGVPA
jgi:signal transduction histidine kinase